VIDIFIERIYPSLINTRLGLYQSTTSNEKAGCEKYFYCQTVFIQNMLFSFF
jgi:hypothetical protein